jgi:hypothetical protein
MIMIDTVGAVPPFHAVFDMGLPLCLIGWYADMVCLPLGMARHAVPLFACHFSLIAPLSHAPPFTSHTSHTISRPQWDELVLGCLLVSYVLPLTGQLEIIEYDIIIFL